MQPCTHSQKVAGRWEPTGVFYFDGEELSNWVPDHTVSTTVDIDLHRYKCTQCGEIRYYSGRARDHFEGARVDTFIADTNDRYINRRR